jgi:serpin B
MKRIILRAISFIMVLALGVNLTACAISASAEDLMAGVNPSSVSHTTDTKSGNLMMSDFAVRLLRASMKADASDGENTLLSPLSVIMALAMEANGAGGNTRAQMEAAIGADVESLNEYLYAYMNSLPEGENYKISLANSIWFKDDSHVIPNPDFLQMNADYYGAGIYKAPFNNMTKWDINNWVKKNTGGMIDKVIDDIPKEVVMYVINALAFEADWPSPYERYQVRDGEFTLEDGSKKDIKLMYDTENRYISDDLAQGFIKYYKGGKYAFAALLPNEGVSIDEYVSGLSGESLKNMLDSARYAVVKSAMPKFKTEYGIDMVKVLRDMGITDAFDADLADLAGLGTLADGNI